jgi:hypothetical protein
MDSGKICQNGQCVGCLTVADCPKYLPALCMLCTDGSAGCAHWICNAGTCQMVYCP